MIVLTFLYGMDLIVVASENIGIIRKKCSEMVQKDILKIYMICFASLITLRDMSFLMKIYINLFKIASITNVQKYKGEIIKGFSSFF